ncbi:cupin domain-containing protein [Marinobacter adhaerens]|uniref:Cupin domain-containing protein n=1 Tax=Marinobacter adhaerens TaxID=1033846 RepID=A0A851HMN6_9GAMM|nr:cupin domain-containing protein [Marinobacter adhaerens]NWN90283.1 cupin domain-containing protein [Marinobacter adhaerens]
MEQSGQYKVTPLQKGSLFVTKRMEATSGTSMPRHKSSIESVLVVTDGQCLIRFDDEDHAVAQGESFVVPAQLWHQVVADPDFKAVHIMPKEIRFEFSK